MSYLDPRERGISSRVCTTWRRVVQDTWLLPYGQIEHSLGFHALMTGKILRQCIPHVTWTVPHLGSLPVNIDVVSPPFTQDHSLPLSAQEVAPTWRLRLRRLPQTTTPEQPEQPDLILTAEILRIPSSYNSDNIRVFHYARIENPASYSWAEFKTGCSQVFSSKTIFSTPSTMSPIEPPSSSIQLLTSDVLQLTSKGKGFLCPPNFDSIQFKVMLARDNVEHVAVFTEEDIACNEGPDLFKLSTKTIVLHMEQNWLKGSQAEAQNHLKKALQHVRPQWDFTYKEFWRVIMRRNHSFRPVSAQLRSYESPFYAVYAVDVLPSDSENICLFFKVFDGTRLRYIGKRFGGPNHTLRTLLRDYDLNKYALFEEVHSRRLDKIESVDISINSMELWSGDVVVLCPQEHTANLTQHYQSLVFTSPLVQLQPNMWHT